MADLLLPDFTYFHKFTYVISYSILVHIAMTVIITSITNFISLFFRCVSLHHIRGSTIVIFTISIFHGIPSKLYLLAHSHFFNHLFLLSYILLINLFFLTPHSSHYFKKFFNHRIFSTLHVNTKLFDLKDNKKLSVMQFEKMMDN